jgi:hypothetical protein
LGGRGDERVLGECLSHQLVVNDPANIIGAPRDMIFPIVEAGKKRQQSAPLLTNTNAPTATLGNGQLSYVF